MSPGRGVEIARKRLSTNSGEIFLDLRRSHEGVLSVHLALQNPGIRVDRCLALPEFDALIEALLALQSQARVAAHRLAETPPRQSPPNFAAERSRRPKAYLPWTEEEEAELRRLTASGSSPAQIAAALQRPLGAVRSRLRSGSSPP